MKTDLIPIQVRGAVPAANGCAIFLGNEQKTFVIYVDHSVGMAIIMFLRNTPKERPLTHDLIGNIFAGLGVKVDGVVINALQNGTFFARLFLRVENELGKKFIEIDARPSDCIAIAIQQKSPIYVVPAVFNAVEDVSEHFNKLNQNEDDNLPGSEEETENE